MVCQVINCDQLLAHTVQTLTNAISKVIEECKNDNPSCSTATKFQLTQAGILDTHDFKAEFVGKKNVSRYDICACKDGSIKIAGHGQCGKQGAKIDTYARWK